MQRRMCYYSGTVQGVGFRYSTQQVARGHAVTGFVRNLSDGRVEVIVEGTAAEIDAFLGGVARRMGNNIDAVDSQTAPATGEFTGFDVRYH